MFQKKDKKQQHKLNQPGLPNILYEGFERKNYLKSVIGLLLTKIFKPNYDECFSFKNGKENDPLSSDKHDKSLRFLYILRVSFSHTLPFQ
jgi:hypothetical protein